MKKNKAYLITVVVSLVLVAAGHIFAVGGFSGLRRGQQDEVVRAKVIEITDRIKPHDVPDELIYMYGYRIEYDAKILGGPRRGTVVNAAQIFSVRNIRLITPEVKEGGAVLLLHHNGNWFFNGFYRLDKLLGLGLFFILCVIIFGRTKGVNTVLSLCLTCGVIFSVFIPSILSGANIYFMSFVVCVYTIVMTLLLVIGINKKSLTAAIGCISGLVITVIITLIMDKLLLLTGIIDENSRYLTALPIENRLNLSAIMFAGIIIGAIGAIMDVSMSISSSLWEVKEKAPNINSKTLFISGITIGRDIMGTMANTLILAYIGSSLSGVLIYTVYSNSLITLVNTEMIVVEILRALVGSLGVLFAMPLTAFFCSLFYLKGK